MGSIIPKVLEHELKRDAYGFKNIDFKRGDVVLDIGANIGLVSIYLAKTRPGINIYAYEPIPENYRNLVLNLALNGVTNVQPHNVAIGDKVGKTRMIIGWDNTGGATSNLADMSQAKIEVDTIPLDLIFIYEQIEQCKVLKIDTEGAEYSILYGSTLLDRVEYLVGEFHTNRHLLEQGYTPKGLKKYCKRFIKKSNIITEVMEMCE
jgi:FkbM family methyltransferase